VCAFWGVVFVVMCAVLCVCCYVCCVVCLLCVLCCVFHYKTQHKTCAHPLKDLGFGLVMFL
jgi:hypothetical protein